MASTDHDLPLKLRIAAVFRRMGYTVFNEVDLCTYTYRGAYRRKQITDFDVLGVKLEPDLDGMIAVAECKSVDEKAMENLLKLNGVKEFFKAHKAYFVQHRIDVNAREVGAQLGITCLSHDDLQTAISSLEVREDVEVKVESDVYHARVGLLKEQKSAFPHPVEYLKYDFWTLPDNRNIINLVRLLTQLSKKVDSNKQSHVVLGHQLVIALALSVLRLGGMIVKHNISDLEESLLTALLGGARDRRDREALHDTVARMLPEAKLPLVPDYFPQLAELVNRYVNAMGYSCLIPAWLDDVQRQLLCHGESVSDANGRREFNGRTVKLARDLLHFAINVAGVPKTVFQHALTE